MLSALCVVLTITYTDTDHMIIGTKQIFT